MWKSIPGDFATHRAMKNTPRLGLLLAPEAETDDEDLALVTGMYERIGENHHAPLVYSALTHQKSPLEVAHEIGHCQRIA